MTQGACLNCGHPMRSQPNGVAEDFRVRNLPQDGQDMGGNPLKEGILGDYQNRKVRDESFAASVKVTDMDHSDQTIHIPWQYEAAAAEIPVEIDKVAPPGISNEYAEEIMEEDDKKKKKKANLFGDIGNAAQGVGNYVVHHPWQSGLMAGGALLTGGMGAGLIGGGLAAGEAAGAGALAGGAAGAAEDVGAQAAAKAAPSLMSRALGLAKGGLKTGVPMGVGNEVGRELGQDMGMGGGGAQPSMNLPVRGIQQLGAAGDDKETPTSHGEIPSDDTSDPEKVDPHEKNDDTGEGYFGENDVNDIGGTTAIHPDSAGAKAFMALLPLVLHHAQEGTGAEDPIIQALHQMLEKEFPGYTDTANDGHMHELFTVLQGGSKHGDPHSPDGHEKESAAPLDAQPSLLPPVTPGEGLMGQRPGTIGHCPQCGSTADPTQRVCPQCGAQIGGAPGHGLYAGFEMPQNMLYEGQPQIPPGMDMNAYRHTPHDILPVSNCPQCGDMVRPMHDPTSGQPICPHCLQPQAPVGMGAEPHSFNAKTASGPQTPEQILAVQELLKQQGRTQEIPMVADNPENYARELAMIQQRDVPPQEGLNANPPEPPIEQAPPGATMPVPGMGSAQQMQSAINKWTADSIAPVCPNCGSHTTGLVSNEGDAKCHSCGNTFSTGAEGDDGASTDHVHTAYVDHPENTVRWKTSTGEPLQENHHYYLHTKGVEIPDVVKVDRVKPDEIEITYEGEHGLSFRSSIPTQDAHLYGYTFTPYPGGASQYSPEEQPDPNEGNDDNSGYAGDVEETDTSNTHQFMTNTAGSFGPEYDQHIQPGRDWLADNEWGNMEPEDFQQLPGSQVLNAINRYYHGGLNQFIQDGGQLPPTLDQGHTAAHPYADRQLAPGVNLHSEPYVIDPTNEWPNPCPNCGGRIDRNRCTNCGTMAPSGFGQIDADPDAHFDPEAKEMMYDHVMQSSAPHNDPNLDWLTEGTKLAGKKYTPMEQREFIDEQGVARNSDKMDLSNTHYESNAELTEDDFLFL